MVFVVIIANLEHDLVGPCVPDTVQVYSLRIHQITGYNVMEKFVSQMQLWVFIIGLQSESQRRLSLRWQCANEDLGYSSTFLLQAARQSRLGPNNWFLLSDDVLTVCLFVHCVSLRRIGHVIHKEYTCLCCTCRAVFNWLIWFVMTAKMFHCLLSCFTL